MTTPKKSMLALEAIISLLLIAIMILFASDFIGRLLFGGAEYKAFNGIKGTLESLCDQNSGVESTQVNVYLPDSYGSNKASLRFIYIALEGNNLRLMERVYSEEHPNDLLAAFGTWLARTPGHSTLKQATLKKCKGYELCGIGDVRGTPYDYASINNAISSYQLEVNPFEKSRKADEVKRLLNEAKAKGEVRCNSFAFESNEGSESLTLSFWRLPADKRTDKGKIVIGLNRDTLCGDGRCCGGENKENCPNDCCTQGDCSIPATCKRFTE